MKKFILTLSLVAVLGSSFVSCSTDDSAIDDTKADGLSSPLDNGDKNLPRPIVRG